MVAVFTGTGLGLFDSSLTQLGGGSGGVGQSRERQYVNLANGNLVMQAFDESVLTRGLPIAFVRTYNSLGQATEAGRTTQIGQDGWLHAFERRVVGPFDAQGASVAYGTAGSRVTRVLGDGTETVFTWDASRNAYVSTVGEGAHDTLVFNGATQWTWTEGSTRNDEVYDVSGTNGGRLLYIRDTKSGARYAVTYSGSGPSARITAVVSASPLTNGDGMYFVYDASNRLISINVRENGTTRGQVWYEYDTSNRLTAVITDLDPDVVSGTNTLSAQTGNNAWNATPGTAANDGKLFRTSYSYVGSSLQIASVVNSDGSRLSFVYDGNGRVTHVTVGDLNNDDGDGLGRTTLYTYGSTDAVTNLTAVTVRDPSGQSWTYRFDATTKALRQIESPAVNGVSDVTTYSYDPSGNGNLLQATTSRGATTLAQVSYTHDARGNVLSEVDLLGNRIDRTWSATNQLLTETRYTTPNPNTAPTNYQPTTRYVYDSSDRLRFVVNAQGEVTEYQYGASGSATGLVTMMRRFTGAIHDVAALNNNQAIALSTMTGWTSGKLAQTERTDYVYDAMGRLQQTREYAQVAQTAGSGVAVGDGVLDASTNLTFYTYDAQGLLRQRIVDRGASRTLGGASAAGDEVTDYLYDGMGRLLSVLTRDYGTAAMPDRRTNAAAYDAWLAANDATTVLTQYVYTDSGNQIATTHDTGMVRTEVRNVYGQVIAVTESVSAGNPAGQRVANRKYDAAGRLIAEESLIEGTAPNELKARTYYIHDVKGRLSATIDATGAVVELVYDGMDRVVETRRYANRVTPQESWWTGTPPTVLWRSDAGTPPANALVVTVDATRDQVVQASYDGAGRLSSETVVGADASRTRVTTYTYDGAHRLTQVQVTDGAGTPATARTTRSLYDKAGRVVATVDAEGYVTETVYDYAGRVAKTIRYADVSPTPAATDLALLRPAANAPKAAQNQVARYFYDGRGQQVGMLETLSETEGYLTEYVYDEAQNQRAVKAYAKRLTGLNGSESLAVLRAATYALDGGGQSVALHRLTRRQFNSLGQVTVEVTATTQDGGPQSTRDAQLLAGLETRYTYDEAGRLVKTSSGETSEQIREGYLRYDAFGHLTGELSGEGAALLTVGMSQAQIDALYAQYGVRHSYDLLGRRTESVDAQGNKTWYFYDRAGRQTFVVRGLHDAGNVQNAQGEVRQTRYDAFGNTIDEIAYSGRISLAVAGSRDSVWSVIQTWETLGQLTSVDSRAQYAYDRRGLLIRTTDAEGYRTTYDHDAFGGLSTVRTWNANETLVKKTSYVHDRRGSTVSATEANAESGATLTLTRTTATSYDAFGRATTLTDGRGTVTTLVYDRLGRQVTQSTDLGGGRIESTTLAYDAYSRVTTRTDALGNATTYAYDDTARAMTVTTPEGVAITTTQNRFGQTVQVRQSLPGGGTATTTTVYDRNGNATSATDALGKVATQAYDARGLLTLSTDASGRAVAYEYDAAGRLLTRREDPNGLNLTTTYAYDGQGRQIRVTDASGRVTTLAYDRKGQLIETVRDPQVNGVGLGLKTTYAWDRDGRQLTVTEGAGTANATTVAYGYDALGRRISETLAPGTLDLTTTYAYDANDNVTTKTDASGRVTRFAYDAANRLRYTVDGMGGVSEVAYDLAGRATMTRVYAKAANLSGLSTAPTDAEVNALVSAVGFANDALDEVSYRVYDRDGRVRLSVDGAGGVREAVYDTAGRVLRETRYAQAVSLTTTLRGALKSGSATVASVGATASAADESVRYAYDAANRVRFTVDAMGSVTEVAYDAAGRTTMTRTYAKSVNPASLSAMPTENEVNALVTAVGFANDALDAVFYSVYDAAGRLQLSVDGVGGVREASYDGAGRVLRETRYAQAANLTPSLRDALEAGTATAATVGAVATAADETRRSVYDAAGRLTFSIDGTGGYVRTWYDGAGRVSVRRAVINRFSTAGLSDATTVAQLDAMVQWGGTDDLDMYVYDAAGRLRYELQAVGDIMVFPFTASVTERSYDGAGRVLNTRAFSQLMSLETLLIGKLGTGTATEADFATFAAANASTAQSQRNVYDAAGRLTFSVDGTGGYVRTWYDGAGRVSVRRAVINRFSMAGLSDATTVAQLDAMVQWGGTDDLDMYVYDAAGRLRYELQAVGDIMVFPFTASVTERSYDGAGRVLNTRAFSQLMSLETPLIGKLGTGTATEADFATFAAANASTAQSQRNVYDAAGRAVYTIDAIGAYTRTWYDGIGRATVVRRFATTANPEALGDATTVAQMDAQLVWTAADPTEYRAYDAAGRMRIAYNSLGLVTQIDHDGAGRATVSRSYAVAYFPGSSLSDKFFAGTASVADFSAFTAANEATARVQSQVYDAAGRQRYSLARDAGVWTVGERQYDGAGRVTAEVAYGVTIAHAPGDTEAQVAGALQAQLSADPQILATQRRTTRYLHDAAGQQRFVFDATGAVSEQRYDGVGRVVETRSYGVRPNNIAMDTVSVAAWAQGQATVDVRRVSNSYDAAGRLSARTDALGHSETFVYDGAGRITSRTDRAGAQWNYQYDSAGRRVSELGPAVRVTTIAVDGSAQTTVRSIRTRLEYDALGNLTRRIEDADQPGARITDHVYDSRGNRIRTILPDAGVLNVSTGAIVASGVRPTIETTYDALGRAVVQKNENDRYSYLVYDALGRVAYEIDQAKYVTAYAYDAYGQQTTLVRYATALDTNATAFSAANWQAGQAIGLEQIQATGSLTPNAAADRSIATSYDQLGRKTQVTLSSVDYIRSNGTEATGSPTTAFVYNAYGEVARESVLLEGTAGQGDAVWAHTWRWYDAAGRNTITVDAEGHVTALEYNATGETVRSVEYARAVSTAALGATPPTLPPPGDAATGADREMRWSYDALGRKASETAVRRYQRTDGSSGVRDVVTTYGYDAEDRVTSVAGETGTTTTTYDLDGRMLSVREQARDVVAGNAESVLEASSANTLSSAALYASRSPYTTLGYDAFGAVVLTVRHAQGMNGNGEAPSDPQDQIERTIHDGRGRAVWTRNAIDSVIVSEYDAAGRTLRTRTTLTGNDGRTATAQAIVDYDALGRQTAMRTEREQFLGGTSQGVFVDAQESVVYNAFGEIVAKTHQNVDGTLAWTYDAAGRLISDNTTGALRRYGYNLAGHQVRESHKVKLDAATAAIDAVTRTQTDKLGRAIAITLPSHNAEPNTTSLVRQVFDRWGNVVQVVDARGYQTDYQYNQDNQVVRETRPLVWVVGENGGGSWQRPVNQWYYDALGRLIGTRDANGNLRTMAYDAVGRHVSSTDALGNTTRYVYDVFGNQALTQDALGVVTFKAFDRGNRVSAIGDYLNKGATRELAVLQAYTLNEAGDRRAITDALGRTMRYEYDSQQRMIHSRTATGVEMWYGYDTMGRKISETNELSGLPSLFAPSGTVIDADNQTVQIDALGWKYDVFGRVVDHNLLSGRDFNYAYDAESGQLMSETSTGGLGLADATAGQKTYTYYANGRIRTITEAGGGTHVYAYDAAGNRIYEETTATDAYGQQVHTVTRTVYDSNNRVQRVTQDDMNGSVVLKRVFELLYDYDANGNRRRVVSRSGYGPNVDGIVVTNASPTVVAAPADRGVKKGQLNQFRLLFSDVFRDAENDAMSLTIARDGGSALPSWLVATRDPQTGEIVFTSTAPAGAVDEDVVVRLTASETGNPGNTASTVFTVKLRANSGPTLLSQEGASFTAVVGEGFGRDVLVSDFFRDIDVNDALTLSVIGTDWPAWLSADTQSPGMLRMSGTPTGAGSYTFTVRATDLGGQSVDKQVTIVSVVNHAPTVQTAPAPVVAKVGQSFSWIRPLSQVFVDADGDAMQISATGLPEWLTFQSLTTQNPPELRLQGLVPPTEVDGRLYTVQLKATDKYGATVTTVLQITTDGNLAPVPQQTQTVSLPPMRINDPLNYTVSLSSLFVDPDGDELVVTPILPPFSPLWSWLHYEVDRTAGTLRLFGTPTSSLSIGTLPFTLQASDPAGATASINFQVSVAADTPPARNTSVVMGDATLAIGRSFTYTVPADAFTDADGDTIALSAYWLRQVQEPVGDDPPVMTWVTYMEPLPVWMTFNATTRTLSGTVPSNQAAGTLAVRIVATDPRGLSSLAGSGIDPGPAGLNTDADILFNLQPWTNGAPQYTPGKLSGQTLVHGGAVDLPLPTGSFVEPDGDGLTYSAEVQIGGNWVSINQIGLGIDPVTGRITGTATNLVGTAINARILATDPQGLSGIGTFAFAITNTPPVATTIPTQQVGRNVNWNFALSSFFSDVNADALTYSVSGLPAALSLNSATGTISGQPTVALGDYTVTVTASDGRGGSASAMFTLQVTNSSPIPATVPNQTATAGTAWSYQAPAFTDPNGDPLVYSASGLPAWMSFNATTRTFSGNAAAVGSWTITLTATDPAGVSSNATFVVTTPNVAPTATTIPPQSVGRNAALNFGTAGYFSDINGDALSYSASGLPAGLSINATTGVISGTPTTLGSATVTVTVADGRGGTANATFTLAVTNSAPVYATALPNRSGQLGAATSWTLPANTFTDPNGDALTYALWVEIPAHMQTYWRNPPGEWDTREVAAAWVTASNAGLSIAANGTISGNLGALSADGETFYAYRAKIVATDTAGASAEGIFNIGANVAPTAPSVTAPLAKQNLAYSLTLPAFGDANGDTLSYTVGNLPPGLTFNASTRTISGTPTTGGAWTVTYSANDGMGGTAGMSFTLTVEANAAPVAPSVGAQSGTTNAAFALTLPAFTDANGDALTYTIGNLPPGLSFNATTRQISGTPTTVGSWTVSYSANDGRGGTTSTTFAFSVSAPVSNQPPQVANALADQLLMPGAGFSFTFPANSFLDPEGQALTYTHAVIAGPNAASWLTFNAATRTFSGTASNLSGATWTVRVTAKDSANQTVYDDFTITIDEAGGGQFSMPIGGGEQAGESYGFEMGIGEGATTPMSSPSTGLPVQEEERWFTYDAENRLKIVNGVLVGTAGDANARIELRSDVWQEVPQGTQKEVSDSYGLIYDAVGRETGRYQRSTVDGVVQDQVAFVGYDQRGNRLYETYAQTVGGESKGIYRKNTYDAAGQLTEVRRYFELGTIRQLWVAPIDRYGNDAPPPPGSDPWVAEDVNVGGWLMQGETYAYDADGRVRWQETRGRETNFRYYQGTGGGGDQYDDPSLLQFTNRVDYTLADNTADVNDNPSSYDAAGRLTSYRYSATGPGAPGGYTHTFTMGYEGWESWQETQVAGVSTHSSSYPNTTNTIKLDAYGRIREQREHTDKEGVNDTIRAYVYSGDGAVLNRRHGYWDGYFRQATKPASNGDPIPQNYRFVHAAGQQVVELEAGGEVRVSLPSGNSRQAQLMQSAAALFQPKQTNRLSEMNGVAGSGVYSAGGQMVTVVEGETLQSLAQRIYGAATYWYVLADANGMSDATAPLTAGLRLKAPTVSVSKNDANTFRPYNPSEAIGSTTPNMPYIPPPEKAGCNAVAMVLLVVIAIVVTVWTAGAASFMMTGLTSAGGAGVAVASAAIGAAAGSIVSQGIGSLMGVTSFSWRQVAVDTLVGAATAGIGEGFKALAKAGEAAGAASRLAKFANIFTNSSGGLTAWGRTAQGVGTYLAGVAANKIVDRDTNFSWGQVATTAFSSYVSAELNPNGSFEIFDEGSGLGRGLNRFAGGFFDAGLNATARRMVGGEKQNWNSIAINVASQLAGQGLSNAIEAASYAGPSELDVMPANEGILTAEDVGRQPPGDGLLKPGVDAIAETSSAPSAPSTPEPVAAGGALSGAMVDEDVGFRRKVPRGRGRPAATSADDVRRDDYGRPFAEGTVFDQLMKIDAFARSQRDFGGWKVQAVLDSVYPIYYKTDNPWAIDDVLDAIQVRAEPTAEDKAYYQASWYMSRGSGYIYRREYWDRFHREGRTITIAPRYTAGELAWRNEPVNRLLNTIGEAVVPWAYERERRNRGDWQSPPLKKWTSALGKMGVNTFFETINSVPVPDEDGGWLEPRTEPVYEFDNQEIDAAAALAFAAVPASIFGGEFTAARAFSTTNRLNRFSSLRYVEAWDDLGVPPRHVLIGEEIGSGQYKAVYALQDDPTKVVALSHMDSIAGLQDEISYLNRIGDAGVPVVQNYGIVFAGNRPGILMDNMRGAITVKPTINPPGIEDAAFSRLGQNSVQDLESIREFLQSNTIDDFQVMVTTNGRVLVHDPAGLSPRPANRNFLMLVDDMLKIARSR